MAVDPHVYYAMIREFRPSRVIEVGCGQSTFVSMRAAKRNTDDGSPAHLTAVEPYPSPELLAGLNGVELIESKVQNIAIETFTSLGAGDILFIDSSHVLKAGSDVKYLYLEILPRLPPGVFVHIHDISLPDDYPEVCFRQRRYWNEQYLLQSFLAFNDRFVVLWPGNAMWKAYPAQMLAAVPEIRDMQRQFPDSTPSSLWMRS